jgi:maltose alpha-D-glucosyltransferase / alpha-amylase
LRRSNRRADEFHNLFGFARLWELQMSSLFLKTYGEAMAQSNLLPADLTKLMDAFMLDRAFHELEYEMFNRPQWVQVPLQGLLSILEEQLLHTSKVL